MVSDWQTGLFDCCSDMGLCGACLPIVLSCQIASDMHECCLCGGSIAMRTMYRTRYGIPGSIFNDYVTLAFCYPCALCQLKRDIDRR
ncbi:Placenta-specific gene 8 protein, partial [Galemys pyrenaicus]